MNMERIKVKRVGLTAILVILALMFTGCAPTDVDTGSGDGDKSESKDNGEIANEKRFKANQSTEALGVKVQIAEVVMKEDRIEVGMNLENTNSQQVSWYPDQDGKAIIGDKQLNADMLGSGEIGGEIANGIKQDGVLVFTTSNNSKIKPEEIKEIQLNLGEIMSEDYTKNEKVNLTIPVK